MIIPENDDRRIVALVRQVLGSGPDKVSLLQLGERCYELGYTLGAAESLPTAPYESTHRPIDPLPTLAELERRTILDAVKRCEGSTLRAAAMLGIGKTTMYRKLKEYSPTS